MKYISITQALDLAEHFSEPMARLDDNKVYLLLILLMIFTKKTEHNASIISSVSCLLKYNVSAKL